MAKPKAKDEIMECPQCLGTGQVYQVEPSEAELEEHGSHGKMETCKVCEGDGRVIAVDSAHLDNDDEDDILHDSHFEDEF